MKTKTSTVLLALAMLARLPASAGATTYCANFDDGTQTCDIPTLETCEQSIEGVGGSCGPDPHTNLPPNLLQRMIKRADPDSALLQPPAPPAPSSQQPGGLNWMPPPPGQ